jgi:hypothetical protein
MHTQRILAAEQKVRDAEKEMRDINRRMLHAQVAMTIFPLLLGAVFSLYVIGESALFAAVIGFGSILLAGIGIWLIEHSDLAKERQRVWNAREVAWNQLPDRKRNQLLIG